MVGLGAVGGRLRKRGYRTGRHCADVERSGWRR